MAVANDENDEVIIRRIPPVTFKDGMPKGLKIRGRNFTIRHDIGETGVSVNQRKCMSPAELLEQPGTLPGSAIAQARVSDIKALGLEIVEVKEACNPGHCEIRSSETADLDDSKVRDALAELFEFCDT